MRNLRAEAGKRIRNRRLDLNYTSQAALAQVAGVGARMVAAAETGERIGAKTKLRLDRALQWSEGGIDALLNGHEPTIIEQPDPDPPLPTNEDMVKLADSLADQIQELQEQLRRMGEGA